MKVSKDASYLNFNLFQLEDGEVLKEILVVTVRKKIEQGYIVWKKKFTFHLPYWLNSYFLFSLFFSVGAYDLGSSRVNNISLLISMRRRLNESVALSHLELSLWIVQGLTKWRLKEPYKIWQTNSCNGLRVGRVKVGHTYISIYFQCPFWLSCSIIKYKTILVWRLLSNTLRCDLNLSQADFGTLKSW